MAARAQTHIHETQNFNSTSIQPNFSSLVTAGIHSMGMDKIPSSLEKKIENVGCRAPAILDPKTATNTRMIGLLKGSIFLNPLVFFFSA